MSASVDRVIGIAAAEVGYYVAPGGVTKYGSWYGLPRDYWCAMFVSWVAAQAGATDIIPRHAYTPSGVDWFKKQGRWHNGLAGVRRGDIVYFDFAGAPYRVSHVGFVESVNADGSVNTIEGNTSGTAGGNQRAGGLCARKRRKAYIVGYGRPAYSTTKKVKATVGTTLGAIAAALGIAVSALLGANPGTTPDTPVAPGVVIEVPQDAVVEPNDPVVVVPDPAPAPAAPAPAPAASSGVLAQQQRLNQLGYGLAEDGIRGPKTIAAIKAVQARCGIVRDGVYGPVTTGCVDRLIAGTSSTSVVRWGDTGAKVTTLQRKLVAAGYRVTVDGIAKNQTIGAVYAVQVRCGIVRDRIAGPITTACLDRLAGGGTNLSRVLVEGSRGADVTALQKRLGVKADGIFGPITETALIRYQAGHGLKVDGRAGPQVARSLGWTYGR